MGVLPFRKHREKACSTSSRSFWSTIRVVGHCAALSSFLTQIYRRSLDGEGPGALVAAREPSKARFRASAYTEAGSGGSKRAGWRCPKSGKAVLLKLAVRTSQGDTGVALHRLRSTLQYVNHLFPATTISI